jgi:hypothetical protein
MGAAVQASQRRRGVISGAPRRHEHDVVEVHVEAKRRHPSGEQALRGTRRRGPMLLRKQTEQMQRVQEIAVRADGNESDRLEPARSSMRAIVDREK